MDTIKEWEEVTDSGKADVIIGDFEELIKKV